MPNYGLKDESEPKNLKPNLDPQTRILNPLVETRTANSMENQSRQISKLMKPDCVALFQRVCRTVVVGFGVFRWVSTEKVNFKSLVWNWAIYDGFVSGINNRGRVWLLRGLAASDLDFSGDGFAVTVTKPRLTAFFRGDFGEDFVRKTLTSVSSLFLAFQRCSSSLIFVSSPSISLYFFLFSFPPFHSIRLCT